MFDKAVISETHTRTLAKAACYRVMSIVITLVLTLLLGGNWMQALAMGTSVLVIGSIHYYLYDRLWLLIGWNRNSQGEDTVKRSLVKSVIYRVTVLLVVAAVARVIFAESTFIAFALAGLKFITNALGYFLIERIFNRIQWGRKGESKIGY
jgi:uncharacterized membrane protein